MTDHPHFPILRSPLHLHASLFSKIGEIRRYLAEYLMQKYTHNGIPNRVFVDLLLHDSLHPL